MQVENFKQKKTLFSGFRINMLKCCVQILGQAIDKPSPGTFPHKNTPAASYNDYSDTV